ncbi:tetratricopeptide repeat protein [Candidatus Uhrbacteria bacterium]|nr:tetratricopeptide repeat protein [Candidatus Uhrbacteria bacterium]
MDWWWIIPVAMAAISFLGILAFFLRLIPRLRLVNPDSMEKVRVRKLKEQIVLTRLSRVKEAKIGGLLRGAAMAIKGVSLLGRRAVQKVYALEQYYTKVQKMQESGGGGMSDDAVKQLFREADDLLRKEEFLAAEKRYIEVISHRPKYAPAYEKLGNLYLKSKQLTSARETLSFAIRLSPKDPSLLMSMGELSLAESKPAEAVVSLRQAVELRPSNPKYIDAYTEASIAARLLEDIQKGIALMKEANPENAKLAGWEKTAAELFSR